MSSRRKECVCLCVWHFVLALGRRKQDTPVCQVNTKILVNMLIMISHKKCFWAGAMELKNSAPHMSEKNELLEGLHWIDVRITFLAQETSSCNRYSAPSHCNRSLRNISTATIQKWSHSTKQWKRENLTFWHLFPRIMPPSQQKTANRISRQVS